MAGEAEEYRYGEFTEDGYRALLSAVRAAYKFEFFGTTCAVAHVLWRHDVDMSVQRALRIARLEAEVGVASTFFFLFHSEFYNLLEKTVTDAAREIVSLGHHAGLHFDPAFYAERLAAEEIDRHARVERQMLESLLGAKVEAVSLHDPTETVLAGSTGERLGGMLNVYSARLREAYRYCSDSNGYWRHDRLSDLLDPSRYPRLQVLTHPEWWVPAPLSPYERVRRCANGRLDAVLSGYSESLKRTGRKNVGE